jgi:hypothetical protein
MEKDLQKDGRSPGLCNPLGERELANQFPVCRITAPTGAFVFNHAIDLAINRLVAKARNGNSLPNSVPHDAVTKVDFNRELVFHLQKSMPEAARERKGFFRLFFGLASFVPRLGWHRNC